MGSRILRRWIGRREGYKEKEGGGRGEEGRREGWVEEIEGWQR
jgi:hypothetical protein